MRSLMEKVAARLLKRPIQLDARVSSAYMFGVAWRVALGLARGVILTRRSVVLGSGARIREPSKLSLSGGLTRIDCGCTIDCVSTGGIKLGRNFKLGAFSRMIASGSISDLGEGIRIGDNVGIGEYAYIGGSGGVSIESDTIVGQYFSVHPENHNFDDVSRPIREQGVSRQGIQIGPGCWIGAKVTITDGVSVGRNCVIAAGSVVTRSFPDYSLIGGVPAKLIRSLVENHRQENG